MTQTCASHFSTHIGDETGAPHESSTTKEVPHGGHATAPDFAGSNSLALRATLGPGRLGS